MIAMTLSEIADVVGGEVDGAPDGGRSTVVDAPASLDSRAVPAGGLFVAIRGERADGHDYAEAAVAMTLARRKRAFYTTPIKALSNQKFSDLADVYGRQKVGLLTGDNVINGDAEIVVMTTEVLRNMIYASSSTLAQVEVVILVLRERPRARYEACPEVDGVEQSGMRL